MNMFLAFVARILVTVSLEGIAIFIWLVSSTGTIGKGEENEGQENT